MSAYIVEDKTINRFLSYLSQDSEADWTRRRIQELTAINPRIDPGLLGARCFYLNCLSVDARYGEGQAKEFRTLDYHFQFELATKMQALKSLWCWLCQCGEGDVPASPLFQILDDYAHRLAYSVVFVMPEYQRAEWG